MKETVILFDIGNTLLVHHSLVEGSPKDKTHLSPVKIHDPKYNEPIDYFAINQKEITSIFTELQRKNIKFGFITSGAYDAEAMKGCLEQIYKLAAGSLQDSVFINRHDFGNQDTNKGVKIQAAQAAKKLPENAQIILVDDDEVHIASAIKLGYIGITARGFRQDKRMYVDNSYLQEIINACDLQISLPTKPEIIEENCCSIAFKCCIQ